jgi:hypothetical protein
MRLDLRLEELLRAYYTHFPTGKPTLETSRWKSSSVCWNEICSVSLTLDDGHQTMDRILRQLEEEGIKPLES